jgi:hypothetical protein
MEVQVCKIRSMSVSARGSPTRTHALTHALLEFEKMSSSQAIKRCSGNLSGVAC